MEVAQCTKPGEVTRPSATANEKVKGLAFVGTRPAGLQPKSMRKIVLLVGLLALLVGAAQAQDVRDARFYAQTSDGECGLEFTITHRNETIRGSIAWTDLGLRLRLPEKGFVVVDGKLSESAIAIFNAMIAQKGLAIGFYDGAILPIHLVGLDPTAFSACIAQTDALTR